jgi:hypothetical protein
MIECLSMGQEDNMKERIFTIIHDTTYARFMDIEESSDEPSEYLNSEIYIAEKLDLCEVVLQRAIQNLADTVNDIPQVDIHVKDISEITRKLEDANAFVRAAAESVNHLLAARLGVSDGINKKKDQTE